MDCRALPQVSWFTPEARKTQAAAGHYRGRQVNGRVQGHVVLDDHKETLAAAVEWPGREEPEYRSIVPNRSSSLLIAYRQPAVAARGGVELR